MITLTLKSENWKSFNDYDVYLINVFRMSHTLKRNFARLVYVRKEKKPKLKIFISSLFQGKQSWKLKRKFKYGFFIALCKKTFFDFNSNTGVFLWILRHFYDHLCWRKSANGCFYKMLFSHYQSNAIWLFTTYSFKIVVSERKYKNNLKNCESKKNYNAHIMYNIMFM